MNSLDPLLTYKLLAIVGASFLMCMVVVLTQRWHGALSLDNDLSGVQKIHTNPVPRIGGLGLLLGLTIGSLMGYLTGGASYPFTLSLLVCCTPVFMAGLVEDLTKRVSVRTRLLAAFASAALAIWLMGARLIDLDTPVLNTLISIPALSVLFTVFAVGGLTHSINIIDGLNGLAAGTVALILGGLAALAWMHNDLVVTKLCLWGIAALVGFMLLNYPFGQIFLGDGGAYLAGFWLAECAVLLLARNPEVSTWSVLLCCIYPVWETVFSMYRRKVVARVNTGQPDMAHLHQLLFQQVQTEQKKNLKSEWLSHGVASASIWAMTALCQALAISAHGDTASLVIGIGAFATLYHHLYQRLIKRLAVLETC